MRFIRVFPQAVVYEFLFKRNPVKGENSGFQRTQPILRSGVFRRFFEIENDPGVFIRIDRQQTLVGDVVVANLAVGDSAAVSFSSIS